MRRTTVFLDKHTYFAEAAMAPRLMVAVEGAMRGVRGGSRGTGGWLEDKDDMNGAALSFASQAGSTLPV
jgi:hypothetical protein